MRRAQDMAGSIYTPPAPAPHYQPPDAVVGNAQYGGQYTGGLTPGPIPGYGPPPVSPPASGPPRFQPPTNTHLTIKPGYTPDYLSLIQNDPSLIGARNNAASAESTGAGNRKAAIRAAITRFGRLPAGFVDTYGDVDQSTIDAATNNPYSTIAQLAYNYGQNTQNFKKSLAARGMLQSGDLAYGQDSLDRNYGQDQYNAGNAVTGEVGGAVNTYTGILGQNAKDITTATGTAEQNVYSNPAYRPVEATYADYDPTSSTRFGKAVYKGSDGAFYDESGNPFNPAYDYQGNPVPDAPPAYTPPTEQNPNPNPGPYGVPMSAGFYGFDQYGNWIG